MILKDARVEINSVDLSDHVQSVNLSYGVEPQDETAMGDNTRQSEPGLYTWSLSVTFYQDYAAGEVDATLFSLVGAAAFNVKVRPTTAAISATNPEFSGNVILVTYPPIGGSVGDEHTTTVEFQPAGDLARATS